MYHRSHFIQITIKSPFVYTISYFPYGSSKNLKIDNSERVFCRGKAYGPVPTKGSAAGLPNFSAFIKRFGR